MGVSHSDYHNLTTTAYTTVFTLISQFNTRNTFDIGVFPGFDAQTQNNNLNHNFFSDERTIEKEFDN